MRNHDHPAPGINEDGMTKAALRTRLLAQRQAIPAEVRHAMDARIGAGLLAWWNRHRFGSLGVFWPIRGEPDLHSVYAQLARQGVRLALPTVAGRQSPLVFVAWEPGAPTVRDAYGVQVPAAGETVAPQALLVPCVGFNDAGFRLGYGGGFYDRTLAASPRPATAGIAYAFSRVPFAADGFDIALDTIITD
ncbi:5-formyltetrahydrofolate cyclo-ligase [Noviherbaspirillum aridicola]|uniref:5-formyltetrahydrofolate cyclo-ligase n=1 Tax=Noviherbaspirillum aridicola TaxID=2849687 RepID=A0ABQ4Q131_9BURK|nr:5-formyltetrahydrofolate cyclo-ligase [Noviherbaspirillum aridicola]GIZ50803.1 5-formyltetrahydrofolate cyclo-ligase [Noviherbaspirillum aridicola]